jgi:methionyl-tRNA formyltransferase
MKLIFAGTPDIAAVVLKRLLETEHSICAVLTQPDRPAGRGQKLLASPVKALALAKHIPVHQPLSLKEQEIQHILQSYEADLMIVVAYGLIVPQAVLEIPALGCWNIHVSLLPRWRGAAPIQRAIEAGDLVTGVTIMQMDKGLDTGAILLQEQVEIGEEMNSAQLHDLLAIRGAELLVEALAMQPQLLPRAQANEGMTYAAKITKEEALIDWSQSASAIACKVRAFNPWPMCSTHYEGQTLRILTAHPTVDHPGLGGTPGQIMAVTEDRVSVQTGQGILNLTMIQIPGGKALAMKVFLQGHRDFFKVGSVLT